MIKHLYRIFGPAGLCAPICCACLCARTAPAATVTPSAATNYYFSTPTFPAHIRGEVMGDPPAYRTPRSEDADWLVEAIRERTALARGEFFAPNTSLRPEFGKWNLAETNRFYRWSTAVDAAGVTNVVVGYHLVTNSPPAHGYGNRPPTVRDFYIYTFTELEWLASPGFRGGVGNGVTVRFLDGGASLSTAARDCYDWGNPHTFTNINVYSLPYLTSAVTNSFSTLEVPMTNGTVSVHTNSWSVSTHPRSRVTVTNVWEEIPLDYCHAGTGMFPAYTNANADSGYFLYPEDTPSTRPGSVTRLYELLRGMVRLSDQAATTNRAPPKVHCRRYDSNFTGGASGGAPTISTNSTGYVGAEYEVSGYLGKRYSWNSSTAEYDEWATLDVSEWVTPSYDAIAPTRFRSAVVTTGGTTRVTIKAAYAVVRFKQYAERQEGTIPNLRWNPTVDIDRCVVVPLPSPSLDLSQPVACARVTIDAKSLCTAAAAACGATTPPQNAESYVPSLGTGGSWSAECSSIVLIYRLHPTSKFTDW